MASNDEKAEVKFDLPFDPYPNQLIFMKDAYQCFEKSLFGLFESPTGSGKTLSILCSALTWLKNNRVKTLMCNINFDTSDESVPKWVQENSLNQKRRMAEDMIKEEFIKLDNLRKKVLEKIDYSNGVLKLRKGYKRISYDLSEKEESEDFGNNERAQIIICSRTFSQLNQYVKEFKKLDSLKKDFRLSIGSGRTHICINKTIKNKCKSSEELNDECRRSKCEFRSNTRDLSDITTCYPMDLEELVELGTEMEICPYYSNLQSIQNSDVILAPYVTIINESLRESLGIRVKNNILIFDEGHNLIDSITESNSCKLSLVGLNELSRQLKGYFNKYRTKMNSVISDRVNDITKLVDCLESNLRGTTQSINFNITEFTVNYSLDDFKFHEIYNFLSSTDFCRHLRGWAERDFHIRKKQNESLLSHTSMIYTLKNFIYSLIHCESNDQVIVTLSSIEVVMEIFPVASEVFFHKIVEESKAVIIMSGTLSPMEEFLCLSPSKSEIFIHRSPPVFPQDRLLTSVIYKDWEGEELVFDYSRRGNEREMKFLSNLMEVLSENVPGGIVCFFSSYSYQNEFYNYFLKSTESEKVSERKKIFKEEKNVNVFPEYSKSCMEDGAILMAVFGGNQSEGVDFTDSLARMVVLVGIPYPPDSIKLSLKRDYYKRKSLESQKKTISQNYDKLYNEQRTLLCYKTINQCIGRAMRHREDYSAVLLLDSRYRGRDSGLYLPEYVKSSIYIHESGKKDDFILMLQRFYNNLQ